MQMPITAEDMLVGIFYYMKKKETSKLTADREKLHRAFFDATAKHTNMKSLFSFRERELFPESPQLDQALSNLDATGLISRRNLTPKYYFFEEPLEDSYINISKNILLKAGFDDTQIETVAMDISNLVKIIA
jgi:hypothetical protein